MIMKSITQTKKQLISEKEELRSRLAEAEETLYAIRRGEVDAIVISDAGGEQIYSISSSETPYRTFIEEMNEGAVTLSRNGLILYCNQRFAELVHEPIEGVIGSYFKRFIAPDDQPKFESLLTQQTYSKNDIVIISLISSVCLKLSLSLMPPYLHGDHFILIATDISEMKKKENQLLELHRILEQNLDQIKDLRIDLINAKFEANEENRRLKYTNKKLIKEITKHKQIDAELKQSQKLKKSAS